MSDAVERITACKHGKPVRAGLCTVCLDALLDELPVLRARLAAHEAATGALRAEWDRLALSPVARDRGPEALHTSSEGDTIDAAAPGVRHGQAPTTCPHCGKGPFSAAHCGAQHGKDGQP